MGTDFRFGNRCTTAVSELHPMPRPLFTSRLPGTPSLQLSRGAASRRVPLPRSLLLPKAPLRSLPLPCAPFHPSRSLQPPCAPSRPLPTPTRTYTRPHARTHTHTHTGHNEKWHSVLKNTGSTWRRYSTPTAQGLYLRAAVSKNTVFGDCDNGTGAIDTTMAYDINDLAGDVGGAGQIFSPLPYNAVRPPRAATGEEFIAPRQTIKEKPKPQYQVRLPAAFAEKYGAGNQGSSVAAALLLRTTAANQRKPDFFKVPAEERLPGRDTMGKAKHWPCTCCKANTDGPLQKRTGKGNPNHERDCCRNRWLTSSDLGIVPATGQKVTYLTSAPLNLRGRTLVWTVPARRTKCKAGAKKAICRGVRKPTGAHWLFADGKAAKSGGTGSIAAAVSGLGGLALAAAATGCGWRVGTLGRSHAGIVSSNGCGTVAGLQETSSSSDVARCSLAHCRAHCCSVSHSSQLLP